LEAVSGDLEITQPQPFAVAFPAKVEAISAFLRTKVRSPRIVPDEAELPTTHGAALRRGMLKILVAIEHFCLL
jgi:hypothetical protein